MSAKRAEARAPQWSPPPTEQLLVLERQIRTVMADGETLKPLTYDESSGKWSAWAANLGDLIERAFGPASAQVQSYRSSTGYIADSPERRDYRTSPEYDAALIEWRNGKIDDKIQAARGALSAVAQELERRGATPSASPLVPRAFAFIASPALRTIAVRDYDELRAVADRTTKAAALLAGSVIEAALYAALETHGIPAVKLSKMKLVDLVDEAAAAKLIQARTQKAGHAVRDARNFVHPAVELSDGPLRKVDAEAAIALMNMVLEELA